MTWNFPRHFYQGILFLLPLKYTHLSSLPASIHPSGLGSCPQETFAWPPYVKSHYEPFSALCSVPS